MLEEPEQQSVIRGLQEGNREAWTALYNGYNAAVWRYVARLLGRDSVVIADIVQEVFLAAARSARQFDPARGTLGNWLTGIAHHHVSAHWRQSGRFAKLKSLVETNAVQISHLLNESKPESGRVDSPDLTEVVRAALSQLSAEYASLLTAKYIEDESMESLAFRFGAPETSVEAMKSKLARARREFRSRFERLERVQTDPSESRLRKERVEQSPIGDVSQ